MEPKVYGVIVLVIGIFTMMYFFLKMMYHYIKVKKEKEDKTHHTESTETKKRPKNLEYDLSKKKRVILTHNLRKRHFGTFSAKKPVKGGK